MLLTWHDSPDQELRPFFRSRSLRLLDSPLKDLRSGTFRPPLLQNLSTFGLAAQGPAFKNSSTPAAPEPFDFWTRRSRTCVQELFDPRCSRTFRLLNSPLKDLRSRTLRPPLLQNLVDFGTRRSRTCVQEFVDPAVPEPFEFWTRRSRTCVQELFDPCCSRTFRALDSPLKDLRSRTFRPSLLQNPVDFGTHRSRTCVQELVDPRCSRSFRILHSSLKDLRSRTVRPQAAPEPC
jgi:hypothetical protein